MVLNLQKHISIALYQHEDCLRCFSPVCNITSILECLLEHSVTLSAYSIFFCKLTLVNVFRYQLLVKRFNMYSIFFSLKHVIMFWQHKHWHRNA